MPRRPSSRSALVAAVALHLAAPDGVGADISSGYLWKPMKIGGGGWVTGLDIHPSESGVRYVRTDVSGAYKWEPKTSSWRQIVTTESMPPGTLSYGNYGGVDSLVGAPGDPRIAYLAFAAKPYGGGDGQIFKTVDGGATWRATRFLEHKVKMEPNGPGRQSGERLAVDPANSDIVYFGSLQDGLWRTTDGGESWARVDGVSAGTPGQGVTTVIFDADPEAPATKSKPARTRTIYATVERAGVYKSADEGRSWSRISDTGPGSAGRPRDAALAPDRSFYVVYDHEDGSTGSVWRREPDDRWIDVTPPPPKGGGDKPYWAVAISPADPRRIVVMLGGGQCFVSSDRGASWSHHYFKLKSDNVRWLGRQTNYYLSVGELAFDPFDPEKLWFAEGFGVWWTKDLGSPAIEWNAASEGIEEACGNDVIAPPGQVPVAAMWDLGAFRFDNLDRYDALKSHPGFMSAWALDWCAADPRFLVGVFRSHITVSGPTKASGYSTDGGKTWTRFGALATATLPADLDYGVIAVAADSPGKIVWAPAAKKLPCYTTDRGATWERSIFEGATETGLAGFHSPQKPLCADRVLPGTFYFYMPHAGVFRSTDGGANFSKIGPAPREGRANAILKSTPGHAGHLWFAEGTGGGLWRSIDGGKTWSALPGLRQAFNVGIGKAAFEGGYPTLFAAGVAGSETGVFRSTDEGKTWDQVSAAPLGITDWIDALDGDKEVFGRVYVGFAGAGFAYGSPAR